MRSRGSTRRLAVVTLACALGVVLVPAPSLAITRTVSCGGGRLTAALRLPAGQQLTLVVRGGVCDEHVTIARDNVTLRGEAAAAAVTIHGTDPTRPTILVDGVHGVVIENLTVTGAGEGIVARRRAGVTVQNAVVQDTGKAGLALQSGARALVHANVIQRTGGVSLDGAAATITSNTIDMARGAGIQVANASDARIGRTETGTSAGNTIRGGTGNAVTVSNGSSALLQGNTIESNTGTGLFVVRSVAVLQGGNAIRTNGAMGIFVSQGQLTQRPATPTARDAVTGNGTAAGASGVVVETGGSVTATALDVSGNHGDGIQVSAGALTVSGTAVSANARDGIQGFGGARLTVLDSTVTGNGRDGIRVNFGSSLFIANSGTAATTVVSGHQGNGIVVVGGSALNMSTENGTAAVRVTGNALSIAQTWGLVCSSAWFYGDVSGVTGNLSGVLGTLADTTGGMPFDPQGTECMPIPMAVPPPD